MSAAVSLSVCREERVQSRARHTTVRSRAREKISTRRCQVRSISAAAIFRETNVTPPPPPRLLHGFFKVTPQNVTVGAGGAVIALSEVDDEYEEMLLKATSVLGALGHEKRPGRRGPPGSEPTRPRSPPSPKPEAPVSLGDAEDVAVRDSTSPANSIIGGRSAGVRPSLNGGGIGVTGDQQRVQQQQQQQQAGGD